MLRARPNLPWLLGGILFVLAAGNAQAAENDVVSVEIDHATVFRLAAPAGTIIIGNPSIADATLQDAQTLIITGHTYGQTNLIVLDSEGETISESQLHVGAPTEKLVTVFKGKDRFSYSCLPDCQPTAVPGDQQAYFSGVIVQVSVHDGAGSGRGAATQSTGTTSGSDTPTSVPAH